MSGRFLKKVVIRYSGFGRDSDPSAIFSSKESSACSQTRNADYFMAQAAFRSQQFVCSVFAKCGTLPEDDALTLSEHVLLT
jgi:hypothetical protein